MEIIRHNQASSCSLCGAEEIETVEVASKALHGPLCARCLFAIAAVQNRNGSAPLRSKGRGRRSRDSIAEEKQGITPQDQAADLSSVAETWGVASNKS